MLADNLIVEAMNEALREAIKSPDPSTQNGAVIYSSLGVYLSSGHNTFPHGVEQNEARWERPKKYKYVEHAERNAIYHAAKWGAKTNESIMICPWASCSDCARAIVESGIRTLVRLPSNNEATAPHWHEDCSIGDLIMTEGGVDVMEFDAYDQLEIPTLLRNGETWDPRKEYACVS